MGVKTLSIDFLNRCGRFTGTHSWWNLENNEKQPCYLPKGKADDTTSPVLSRVSGNVLQLHPRRLGSAASSTFATLVFNHNFRDVSLCHLRRPNICALPVQEGLCHAWPAEWRHRRYSHQRSWWFNVINYLFFFSRFARFFSLAVFWGFFLSLFLVSLAFDIWFTSGKFT